MQAVTSHAEGNLVCEEKPHGRRGLLHLWLQCTNLLRQGYLFFIAINTKQRNTTITTDEDKFVMLVDSEASSHSLGTNLQPELNEHLQKHVLLQEPQIITPARLFQLQCNSTCNLPIVLYDPEGGKCEISLKDSIVLGWDRRDIAQVRAR